MNAFRVIVLVAVIASSVSGCINTSTPIKEPVDWVNQYMGNISHLLVPSYPTVHLPNSLLRVYPERGDFTGRLLHGLPVVLTSHRGSFAFNLSPFQGNQESIKPVISYSYDNEKITPYSYTVFLDEQKINVQFAPSHQSALYEMGFIEGQPVGLVISCLNGSIRWNGEAITGYEILDNHTKVYLWLETESRPSNADGLLDNKLIRGQTEVSGRDAAIVLSFGNKTPVLRIRYGISFIDEVQAKRNLQREIKSYDLKQLLAYGRKTWNELLAKTFIEGGTEAERNVFYTSVYRISERPVLISEDRRYFSGFDGKVHDDNGVPFYTDDWIWDTYRAAHPLRVLTEPKKEQDIINSYIRMAEQSVNFWMPTFPNVTGDAHAMNCNHAVASVIDDYSKGLRGFDLEKAYLACKGAIMEKR
jgi:predicted alpha-1,2-mannosidase